MSHSSTSYAALSIHHVVRLHPRERLWVHPLLWTARHLELLQVTFEEPVHAPDCLPPDQEELTWKPYAARWAQQLFVEVSSSLWKGREYRLARKQLPIYFNRRLVSLVECPVLFLTHDCEKVYAQRVPPVAAIIDRGHIDEERACHARSKGRSSKPTNALFDTKLKQLTPRNPFHDPYIVALLIAVAHIQRYVQQKGDGEKQVDTSVYFVGHVRPLLS
ncbi:hypothetical protein FQN50_006965 [Emmonsiellopsis sp. PD_5]|nr:hypothetical protein FQN50_006965 [Emmonsiellopsis sp. PD_5]